MTSYFFLFLNTEGVRANRGMKDATNKEIAGWSGRWFTNARDRNGNRQARRQEAGKTAGPQIVEEAIGEDAPAGVE